MRLWLFVMSAGSEENEKMKFLCVAGLCGIIGSVLPITMVLAGTFLSSWFSWDANALSELGASAESVLFNSAMLIGGFLNFLFDIGLYHYFERKQARSGIALLMLSSVFLALSGVFTVDSLLIHVLVAIGYFTLAPAGFIIIGYSTKDSVIKKLSVASGVAALAVILILPGIFYVAPFNVGFAVPELIEALIILVWTVFISTKLLRLDNK
jgi:hypothetical membrane protein